MPAAGTRPRRRPTAPAGSTSALARSRGQFDWSWPGSRGVVSGIRPGNRMVSQPRPRPGRAGRRKSSASKNSWAIASRHGPQFADQLVGVGVQIGRTRVAVGERGHTTQKSPSSRRAGPGPLRRRNRPAGGTPVALGHRAGRRAGKDVAHAERGVPADHVAQFAIEWSTAVRCAIGTSVSPGHRPVVRTVRSRVETPAP